MIKTQLSSSITGWALLSGIIQILNATASQAFNFNPTTLFREKVDTKVFSSALPIFNIETNGQKIKKDDKIKAELHLVAHNGELNLSEELFYSKFNRKYPIKIRLRGHSSLKFPQKQYLIEMQNPDGLDKEKEHSAKAKQDEIQGSSSQSLPEPGEAQAKSKGGLLGLPPGKAWAFHAPYVDKTLLRNALTYSIARKFPDSHGNTWYAPRTKFAEVFLNGDYRGVYTVTEKIAAAKSRVELAHFDHEKGDSFDFLIKADPPEKDGVSFKTQAHVNLLFEYPGKDDLHKLEKEYPSRYSSVLNHAKTVMDDFERSLEPKWLDSPEHGPEAKIDFQSFVNYILIQEITKNIDGYRRSVYLHVKDNKLYAGPIWDFNLALGNLWFYNSHKPKGWQHARSDYIDGNKEIPWFYKLMQNKRFRARLIYTYSTLRKPEQPLSTSEIFKEIDSKVDEIGKAQKRHFSRWNLLGGPIGPFWFTPPPWPTHYEGEITKLKTWLEKRMDWLDQNILQI